MNNYSLEYHIGQNTIAPFIVPRGAEYLSFFLGANQLVDLQTFWFTARVAVLGRE